jgi:hypothetical protein
MRCAIYNASGDEPRDKRICESSPSAAHRRLERRRPRSPSYSLTFLGLDLSATEALTALKSVRVVEIDLRDGASKRSVTRGTQRAASVLRALGITDLDAPAPPQPGQTVM